MKNTHSNTLFHYTKKLSNLYSILEQGLRVSYSGEQITESIFLGIPMISFCDIPIEMCEEHRHKYGKYAIGLNKSRLIAATGEHLSPVHYIIDDWPVLGAYKHHREYVESKKLLDTIADKKNDSQRGQIIRAPGERQYKISFRCDLKDPDTPLIFDAINKVFNNANYANYVLGITKNYTCKHNEEYFCAYDECEWRIVIPEGQEIDGKIAKWYWSKEEFLLWRQNTENSFLEGFNVEFGDDDVECLIVPNLADKKRLEKHLINIGRKPLIQKIYTCNGG